MRLQALPSFPDLSELSGCTRWSYLSKKKKKNRTIGIARNIKAAKDRASEKMLWLLGLYAYSFVKDFWNKVMLHHDISADVWWWWLARFPSIPSEAWVVGLFELVNLESKGTCSNQPRALFSHFFAQYSCSMFMKNSKSTNPLYGPTQCPSCHTKHNHTQRPSLRVYGFITMSAQPVPCPSPPS